MGEIFRASIVLVILILISPFTFALNQHSDHVHEHSLKGHDHAPKAPKKDHDIHLHNSHKGHDHASHSEQRSDASSFSDFSDLKAFSLDQKALIRNLSQSAARGGSGGFVELPSADGEWIAFQVQERSNFAPGLAKKYPNIKSYRGYSVDQPWVKLHLSLSPSGIAAAFTDVRSKVKTTIERVSKEDQRYVAYTNLEDKRDHPDLLCSTPEPESGKTGTDLTSRSRINLAGEMSPLIKFADESTLTTYRLAVATNGQYTAYHGGTIESALSAINETLTVLNVIFETDIGIRLELIENNDLVIYTDATTDPFQDDPSNLNGTMNAELQQTLDTVIGTENYDVGHVYSGIGGGGNAGAIGAFCNDNVKGSAWSASTEPEGSYFINLIAHEMGHQLGANHTFSMRSEGTGVNVEPGSGTTIMSYAGITGPDDVSNFGEDYYHNVSIIQGLNYLRSQSCDVTTAISNSVPTVEPVGDYSIPVGTPFVLTGVAVDEDTNDVLTYTWEQVDSGIVTSSVFGPENTQGANFRSLFPSSSPTRYFPRLESVIAGELTLTNPDVSTTWETLSTIPREYNFALTVRDNAPGGGGVAYTNTKITAVDNGGAFAVTSQADGQVYLTGSEQTVTWRVAGTDIEPISVGFVSISMSDDGGLTYPYVLAETTANDGSHSVILPDVVSENVRIKVQSIDNIFYSINSKDFTVTRDDIVLTYSTLDYDICTNNTVAAQFTYETLPVYTDTAIFSSPNAPSGVSVEYQPQSASVHDTEVLATISASNEATPDSYVLQILAKSDTRQQSIFLNLSVYSDIFSEISLESPTDQSLVDGLRVELQWEAQKNATSYLVEIATDQSFSQIYQTVTTESSSVTVVDLQKDTTYYWRVSPRNSCGVAGQGAPYSFTTPNLFQAQNLPVDIPSNSPTTVRSTISISDNLVISDINVGVDIDHTYVPELLVTLSSPNGTSVTLLQYACYTDQFYPISGVDASFDDVAADLQCESSDPVVRGKMKPQVGSLGIFNNQSTVGDWVLTVEDIYSGDGGSIDNFTLELVTDGDFVNQPPIALPKTVESEALSSIQLLLDAIDPEGNPLTYTLESVPESGYLSVVQPSQVATVGGLDNALGLSVNGDYLYIANDGALVIVDLSDTAAPQSVASLAIDGEVTAVAVRSDLAYVAAGSGGLVIVDISEPTAPQIISQLAVDDYAYDVMLSQDGGRAYLSNGGAGFKVVDVSNPSNAVLLGSYDTSGVVYSAALSSDGRKAYLADRFGVVILSLDDEVNPALLGSVNLPGDSRAIKLSDDGESAYIAAGFAGIQVVDVSFSFEPTRLASIATNNYAYDLDLSADNAVAYVAAGDGGLQIIDIVSPTTPTLGTFVASPDAFSQTTSLLLSEDGSLVYLADGTNGVQIVNVEPQIYSAGDEINSSLIYTNTAIPSVSGVPSDSFTFKVNDGELDSNLASVDVWMDSFSNDSTWNFLRSSSGDVTIVGCVDVCPTNMIIPETIGLFASPVVGIGDGAFAGSGITSLFIPDSIESIGNHAFARNFLTTLTISASVASIGDNAFAYNNLSAVSFLGDRPALGNHSFFGNRNMQLLSYCEEKSGWPGDSVPIGSVDIDPVESCDSVNRSDIALSQLSDAANAGDASGITLADLNAIIGLNNIVEDNLGIYQTAIEILSGGSEIDQIYEIQSLIDTVNSGLSSCSSTSYFIQVTAGAYPEEIGWELVDASGEVVYEGQAPTSQMVCIADGRYSLQMSDSYGDGWNGANFTVLSTLGDSLITRSLTSGRQGTAAVNLGDYPNDGPTAMDKNVTLVEKIPTAISLEGFDPENDELTYYLASEPQNGSFSELVNFGSARDLAVQSIGVDIVTSSDGNTAYVANYEAGLQILDVTDRDNPFVTGSLDTEGLAFDITISDDGNRVYLADEQQGLQIFDVSDRTNPILLGNFNTDGLAYGVALSSAEDIAYVADAATLQIIDVGASGTPFLLASLPLDGSAFGVTVSDDGSLAYVASDGIGLEIIDVSDSRNPVKVGVMDSMFNARAVQLSVDQTVAYVVDQSEGLHIIDVADPTNPVILSNISTGGVARDLALAQNGAYVFMAELNDIQVFDVSIPSAPVFKSSISTSSNTYGLAIAPDNGTLFTARSFGVDVIDLDISSAAVGEQITQTLTYTTTTEDAESDSFNFFVNDGRLDSAVATVSITILLDDDGDGVTNELDAFPQDPTETEDTDSDGIGNNADADDDNDGYEDSLDDFPLDATEWLDSDGDGIGNNADLDDDNDGYEDSTDDFPTDAEEWLDTDGDGVGNNADNDDDNDGVSDSQDTSPLDPSNDSDGDGVPNNADDLPLDATETTDTDSDGVGDNTDAFPFDDRYSADSDVDGMPDAWEVQFGLDPNDPADAAMDADGDGVSNLEEFLAGTPPFGSIDVDGNSQYDALTDGLLLLRSMFGLTDEALISGTVGSDAIYTTSEDILAQIDLLGDLIDVDGNGSIDALTDGLVTLRYLFGLRGDPLVDGVIGSGASRTTAAEIEAHLDSISP